MATASANYIQSKGHRGISAERASAIYAMDPVYGSLFAYFLLGETLNGVYGYTGAALISVAAVTNVVFNVNEKEQ